MPVRSLVRLESKPKKNNNNIMLKRLDTKTLLSLVIISDVLLCVHLFWF